MEVIASHLQLRNRITKSSSTNSLLNSYECPSQSNSNHWNMSDPYRVFKQSERAISSRMSMQSNKGMDDESSNQQSNYIRSPYKNIDQNWTKQPYLVSLKIQQIQQKKQKESNGNERINKILTKLSSSKEISLQTQQMMEDAYNQGHIKDLHSLVEFAKSTTRPLQESYSVKYLGMKDGNFGVSTSRLPIKRLQKSSSVIEFQRHKQLELLMAGNDDDQRMRHRLRRYQLVNDPQQELQITDETQMIQNPQGEADNIHANILQEQKQHQQQLQSIQKSDLFNEYNDSREDYFQSRMNQEQIYLNQDRLINSYSIPRLLITQKREVRNPETDRAHLGKEHLPKIQLTEVFNDDQLKNNKLSKKAFQGFLLVKNDKKKKRFNAEKFKKVLNKNKREIQIFKNDQEVQTSYHSIEKSSEQKEQQIQRMMQLDKLRVDYEALKRNLIHNLDSSDIYYTDIYLNKARFTDQSMFKAPHQKAINKKQAFGNPLTEVYR